MEIEVISEDKFGGDTYRDLFMEIMSDIGKAFHMEKASLSLKPEIPLFIFSVRLKTEHADKTIADVANIREEGDTVHITITDERYAPEIMKELWVRYGKSRVDQQTRFDIEVKGAQSSDIGSFIVASGEEFLKEAIEDILLVLIVLIKCVESTGASNKASHYELCSASSHYYTREASLRL
ncbi:MAG: methanogenesis marker 17 protein [Candidatus Methanoplasma sp.]|jgi:putative methanogenesis marker protein 17|nr:methanogenesis marker 17 protein [Candidatus Methanoplasma sp.]